MAYGVDQQIGIGQAQVLPQGPSHMPVAQQLYRNRQDREEKERREKKDRDLDEYNRIKIVGDALDPRNFNQLVHTKVRDATAELAAKLKDKPSLADTYLMAQQHAGKLGHMSDQFNQLQQSLSKTRDEYKSYKNINTEAIAEKALGMALKDYNEKGEVDLKRNYFDEALNTNPRAALKGGTCYIPKVDPDELVEHEFEGEERGSRGGGTRFKWKFKNLPSFYDVKDKGKFDAPQVTTKGVPIKIGDKEEMMLPEDAYQRYVVDPTDVLKLDVAIKDKYGEDFDVNTEQGEVLRRIEAFKNVDKFKPVPKVSDRQFEPRQSITNVNISGGAGGNVNDVYGRIYGEVKRLKDYGEEKIKPSLLKGDEQKAIGEFLDNINKGKGEDEKVTLGDTWIKLTDQDEVVVMGNDNRLLFTLPKLGTNLPKQANVKGKQAVVAQGEPDKSAKPKANPTDLRKKYNY